MCLANDTIIKNAIVVEFSSEYENAFWEELYVYID